MPWQCVIATSGPRNSFVECQNQGSVDREIAITDWDAMLRVLRHWDCQAISLGSFGEMKETWTTHLAFGKLNKEFNCVKLGAHQKCSYYSV